LLTIYQRTDLAEEFVAQFASVPLVSECVFLRPKYLRGGVEREVADVLFVHRQHAIIISLKHQGGPDKRSADRTAQWAKKHAVEAAAQLKGAITTLKSRRLWCQHLRRGCVEFDAGQLQPIEAIAAVEAAANGEVIHLAETITLNHQGVPFSYFSVGDLLNLIFQLRSFPELQTYLGARAMLSADTRQTLRGEKLLCERYLLNEGGFGGWNGFENALLEHAARQSELAMIIAKKRRLDSTTLFVEAVADCLSERLSNYEEDLAPEVLASFDPSDRRKHYLVMQQELCDLTLLERRCLGQLRNDVISKIEEDASALAHRAYIDHSRDRLYVIAASKGFDRKRAIDAAQTILTAGLAYYGKQRGIIIVERLGENFELAMRDGFSQHEQFKALGEKMFGHLKVSVHVGSISSGPQRVSQSNVNPKRNAD
jgi:hypothetical protein